MMETSESTIDNFQQSVIDAMSIIDDPVLGTDDNISSLSRICHQCDLQFKNFFESLNQEALQRKRIELANESRSYARYIQDFLPIIILYRLLESESINDPNKLNDEMRHPSTSILRNSCESYENPHDDGNLVSFNDGSSHHFLELGEQQHL